MLLILAWEGYVPTIKPGEVWLDVTEGSGPWHPDIVEPVTVLEVKEGYVRYTEGNHHSDMTARLFSHLFKRDYSNSLTNRLTDVGLPFVSDLESLSQVTNSLREPQ